jgi:hypothetical protein
MRNSHRSLVFGLTVCLAGTPAGSASAQALPPRVAVLEVLVAAQQQRLGLLELQLRQLLDVQPRRVDCAAGQSIADALSAGGRKLSRLRIEVSGTCNESIVINRDDVTIAGVAPGAVIAGASNSGIAVFLSGHRGLRLDDLTLRAPAEGDALRVLGGQMAAAHLSVQGAVTVHAGSSVELFTSTISGASQPAFDGGNGLSVSGNSYVALFDTTITNNLLHGIEADGSILYLRNIRLEGNPSGGLSLTGGSSAVLQRFVARNNGGAGIEVTQNSAVTVDLGFAEIGTFITGNAEGLHVGDGSHASVGAVSIEGNVGSGVFIGDSSSVRAQTFGGPRITANGHFGIECGPPPQVPQLLGTINASHVFGNASGQISCPGF